MATRAREWPNNAREARDRAAEESARGILALRPVLEREMPEAERIRRMAVALDALQSVARWLESVGAQTRPM